MGTPTALPAGRGGLLPVESGLKRSSLQVSFALAEHAAPARAELERGADGAQRAHGGLEIGGGQVHPIDRLAFPLAEEHLLAAASARSYARRRLAPAAAERDHSGRYPLDEIREMGEMGLLAMKVPTELGGGGMDNVGYVLAMQAIATAWPSCSPPRPAAASSTAWCSCTAAAATRAPSRSSASTATRA